MIMIKKTIDENGNETVEKIVKEGEEAEKFVWLEEGENGEKDVRVIIKDGDVKIDEEIEIEIENEERTIEVENEDDGDVEVQVITLDEGEELPEDVRKKLEEHGIDLNELMKEAGDKEKKKSKKKVKIIKKEKKAYK